MAPAPKTPTRKPPPLLVTGLSSAGTAAARQPLVDAALRARDEGDQVLDVRIAGQLLADLLHGLRRVEAGAHQQAHGAVQAADRLRADPLARQADLVEP